MNNRGTKFTYFRLEPPTRFHVMPWGLPEFYESTHSHWVSAGQTEFVLRWGRDDVSRRLDG